MSPSPLRGLTLSRRDVARTAVALASIGAGAIHLALGPQHMSQWVVLGTGFFVSGVVQVVLGLALLRWDARRALALTALSTTAFLGVWLVSRTSGLPVGPQAWQQEAFGRADVLCAALEGVVLLGALGLLGRPSWGRQPARPLAVRTALAAAFAAVLASTGVAVAAPDHYHSACPATPIASGVDKNADGADDGVQEYFACLLRHSHEGGYELKL